MPRWRNGGPGERDGMFDDLLKTDPGWSRSDHCLEVVRYDHKTTVLTRRLRNCCENHLLRRELSGTKLPANKGPSAVAYSRISLTNHLKT